MSKRVALKDLSSKLPGSIDTFAVCASFEDRCLSVSDCLDSDSVRWTNMFYFEQFSKYSEKNRSILSEKFSPKLKEIELDHGNPKDILKKLIDCMGLNKEEEAGKVVIDISTFTRESLLILVKLLFSCRSKVESLSLVYSLAEPSNMLSSGVIEQRSVIGYLGDMMPSRPLHLVVMSGFEHERAKAAIELHEPDYISIGFGSKDGSINPSLHEKNIQFTTQLASVYEEGVVHMFDYSLVNPVDTKDALNKIISKHDNTNVVIAPLNNKISTLGAGLLAIEKPEIQITYSQMANYNITDYSKPYDECIIVDLW